MFTVSQYVNDFAPPDLPSGHMRITMYGCSPFCDTPCEDWNIMYITIPVDRIIHMENVPECEEE